jgi:hypothetical protein
MRVAIVHDWLVAPGGAEKVLEQIVECFPDADLFSLVDFLEDRTPLGGKTVTTSFSGCRLRGVVISRTCR